MSGLLLERDAEITNLVQALAAARVGNGALVVVDGPAGIGKTALLAYLSAAAGRDGVAVSSARGGVLERRYAFGIARELLSAALARAGPSDGDVTLAGPAGRAWAALDGSGPRAPEEGALMHGLFWLVVNLCAREPLVMLVDDAHWCDAPSLRFLQFLARRLEGLPLALVVAARGKDPEAPEDLLNDLRSNPHAIVLRPAELGPVSVQTVVTNAFDESPAPEFVETCHDATGGNPYLLEELLRALAADDVRPTAEAARRVREVGVPAIAGSVLLRIGRLTPAAVSLARAVATLGGRANASISFALAQLSLEEGTQAAERLVAADVFRDDRQLDFRHPLVREAVYGDISAVARAAMHAQAAALLLESGADPERVAAHLLVADPSRSAANVDVLQAAATIAQARGAPRAAAAYLHRALAEPPAGARRAALLRELASVESVLRAPEAAGRLGAALAATSDVRERASIAMDLASVLMYGGQPERAESVLAAAIDALGPGDDNLALRLQTMWGSASLDANRDGADPARIAALRRSANRDDPEALPLRVYLAFRGVMHAEPAQEVLDWLQRGWDDGRLLANTPGHSPTLDFVLLAAAWIEELTWAVEVGDAVLESARRSGSVMAFCTATAHRSIALLRRGDTDAAEADARAGLELAEEHELGFTLPYFGAFLGDVLRARDAAVEAAHVLGVAVDRSVPGTIGAAVARTSLGWLRLEAGHRPEAAADFREAGRIFEARGGMSPAMSSWRRGLAIAISGDAPEAAEALLDADLDLAGRAGVPGVTAQVLSARARTVSGARQIALLEQALHTAAPSQSRLTVAQLELDLGAALRRTGRRRDAREPLRRALDLASRCGAITIVYRARQELEATGARPRRERITGRDALTASERRIADMASKGLTNREIAERLFLTPKTVENHLGRVYLKLGIGSRQDLAASLASG